MVKYEPNSAIHRWPVKKVFDKRHSLAYFFPKEGNVDSAIALSTNWTSCIATLDSRDDLEHNKRLQVTYI